MNNQINELDIQRRRVYGGVIIGCLLSIPVIFGFDYFVLGTIIPAIGFIPFPMAVIIATAISYYAFK